MATLFIVSTPIGNLEDLTHRAVRILSEVTVILAEDTRTLAKLDSHIKNVYPKYTITANIKRFDEHTESKQLSKIIQLLDEGENIALVSDAGTPLLSDPGYLLVKTILDHTTHTVVPIPGASAIASALSVSGLAPIPHMFIGFLPTKEAALHKTFSNCSQIHSLIPTTFIGFESPQRIAETINHLNQFCIVNNRVAKVVILNELTKLHEKRIGLTLPKLDLSNISEIKGEVTLVWRFNV